jgi:anti-sigma factor RsiW
LEWNGSEELMKSKSEEELLINDTAGWSDEWLIQAYVDCQLSAACARRFEERLDAEPELAAAVQAQQGLRALFSRDKEALPPMPMPEVFRWREQAEDSPVSEETVHPVFEDDRILPFRHHRSLLHSLLAPAWNHPLIQAAAVFLLIFAVVQFQPSQKPAPMVAQAQDGQSAEILSLDLPQEGTGAYVYEQPGSNLTVVWVTGLSEGGGAGTDPES